MKWGLKGDLRENEGSRSKGRFYGFALLLPWRVQGSGFLQGLSLTSHGRLRRSFGRIKGMVGNEQEQMAPTQEVSRNSELELLSMCCANYPLN